MMFSLVKKVKTCFLSSIIYKFLAVFLLCLMIPLILLIQFFSYGFHSILIEKEESDTSEKTRFATAQTSNLLEEMDHIATALILDEQVTAILRAARSAPGYEWFEDYKSINNTLSLLAFNANNQYSITIIGKNQTLYQIAAAHNNNLNINSSICQYIEERNGRLTMFNRMLSGFDDNEMISLGRAVYHKQKLLGIILVEVPVSTLDAILNPFENPNTRMYILHNASGVLYDTAHSSEAFLSPELETALAKNLGTASFSDTKYLLMQQNIARLPVSVIALVTTDSVFHESSLLLARFIGTFAFIISVTIIGIFLLIRFFTKDLITLSNKVDAFGENPNAVIRLPVHTTDEVGRLTAGFISMSDRITHLLAHISENEKNKRLLAFQALQAQINPHMIYNTLNTITYLAELQNVENIQEISSSFASLLRSLSNVQGEYLTIDQELAYLNSYISIKKYNLLSDIEITYHVDNTALHCYILKLILQPIVENALIHGLAQKMEDGIILIEIARKEHTILIDISDNGMGMDEHTISQIMKGERQSENTFLRVGIHNIMDRLNLQYEDHYRFEIVSHPNKGTRVHLEFPAIETKEASL